MIPFGSYWAILVVVAAASQTVRNATQRSIAGTAGTLGATYARFVYGLPFAAAFLAAQLVLQDAPPFPGMEFLAWTALGAVMQIVATIFMLAAMQTRSFSVAIALTNTAPVQVALFGFMILGEPVTAGVLAAVLLVTAGTLAMSWPKRGTRFESRSVLLGLSSGSMFALAAVGYRGAAISLEANFLLAASITLVTALAMQTAMMTVWLLIQFPADLKAVFRAWRQSLLAGFAGALASQCWFSAYALETVARVRTLGVVELLFAQIVSARFFREGPSLREIAGIALVAAGVVVVLNA